VIQRGRGGERTSIKKKLAGLFPMKFKSECKAKLAWRISVKTFICSSGKSTVASSKQNRNYKLQSMRVGRYSLENWKNWRWSKKHCKMGGGPLQCRLK
jgi:hypothetical protein